MFFNSAGNVAGNSGESSSKAPFTSTGFASIPELSDAEFVRFRDLIFRVAGIAMGQSKKPLVSGRLGKRVSFHDMASFDEYFQFISVPTNRAEFQVAVDLLTTNETYFFRETKHFEFLREEVLGKRSTGSRYRIWSAASSSGEEAYSIAMLLADCLGNTGWEIMGSDISTRVLDTARKAVYPISRTKDIPTEYLKRFCLKGRGASEGSFLIDQQIRSRVEFRQVNLNANLPNLGHFDVIFLRNVLIYFNQETKREVIERLLRLLRPDGHLIVGHSESLHGLGLGVKQLRPSIYRKV